jgi:predicted dehydrogenase
LQIIGILGCGRVSNDFVQALKLVPSAKVVAVSARNLKSAQAFAERHGVSTFCKSVNDLTVLILSSAGFIRFILCFNVAYIIIA